MSAPLPAQWPAMVYHPDGRQHIVRNQAQRDALSPEWADRPFAQAAATLPLPTIGPGSDCPHCHRLSKALSDLQRDHSGLRAEHAQKKTDYNGLLDRYEELLNAHQKLLVETAARNAAPAPAEDPAGEGDWSELPDSEQGPPAEAIAKARALRNKAKKAAK